MSLLWTAPNTIYMSSRLWVSLISPRESLIPIPHSLFETAYWFLSFPPQLPTSFSAQTAAKHSSGNRYIYLLKKWICNEHMSESCWQSSRRWTASGSNCLEANGMLKGNIRWIRLPFVLPHLPCAHMSNSNYSTVHVWVYVCVCGGGGATVRNPCLGRMS